MAHQIHQHHWRSTLIFVRKMMKNCSPEARVWSDFEDTPDSAMVRYNNERLWAIYGLGVSTQKIWWKASFTDTSVVIEQDEVAVVTVPYSNIHSIGLPEKSAIPNICQFEGLLFSYDIAIIQGENGKEYEIKASVNDNHSRDIYLWHGIKGGAYFDRKRHALEGQLTEV